MKLQATLVAALLTMARLAASGHSESARATPTELLVGAGAGLTSVLTELGELYGKAHPGVRIVNTFASSGSLAGQIERGAPIDVFIPASEDTMEALAAKGLVDATTRRTVVSTTLALIVKTKTEGITSFADLATGRVSRIALGEPSSVPAGKYAEQTLTSLGLLEATRAKAVYAKDVRQAAAWVAAGEADAALAYPTALAGMDVRVVATAPEGSHDPVRFPGAVVQASERAQAARDYLDWLSSSEAKSVFIRHGYTVK